MTDSESAASDTAPAPDAIADSERRLPPSTTVGTGSALGIGCIVIVVLFVLVAIGIRVFAGGW